MTPEQVSELSDNELNRAMIWLYPPSKEQFNEDHFYWSLDTRSICDTVEFVSSGEYEDTVYLDYLEDYNLTMPLAVENKISLRFSSGNISWVARMADTVSFNKNPLRAACECLVLIALADK